MKTTALRGSTRVDYKQLDSIFSPLDAMTHSSPIASESKTSVREDAFPRSSIDPLWQSAKASTSNKEDSVYESDSDLRTESTVQSDARNAVNEEFDNRNLDSKVNANTKEQIKRVYRRKSKSDSLSPGEEELENSQYHSTKVSDSSRSAQCITDYLQRNKVEYTSVHVCHHKLTVALIGQRWFVPCYEVNKLATNTLEKKIAKTGYAFLDDYCNLNALAVTDHFIMNTDSPKPVTSRLFVSLKVILSYLGSRADEQSLAVSQTLAGFENWISAEDVDQNFQDKDIKITQGSIHCNEQKIGFLTVSDSIYLCYRDLVMAMDLQKQSRKGYGFIDKPLQKLGFNPNTVFLFHGKQRQFIRADCLVALIEDNAFKSKQTFGKGLMDVLWKEAAVSASMKRQIVTPKRRVFEEHLEVDTKAKKLKDKGKTKRSLFKGGLSKKKNDKSSIIRRTLIDICRDHFDGDSHSFFESFSKIFVSTKKTDFDGNISISTLAEMLKSQQDPKSNGNLLSKLVHTTAPQVYNLTPLESVVLSGNFSGVRLTERYRQRLPGVFPSVRAERKEKKRLNSLCSSVLLPTRTATGWKIDVKRLLEVLDFKYFKVNGVKHWKVHGDGREFGNRQSTFVSLNILNNEALVHDVKF